MEKTAAIERGQGCDKGHRWNLKAFLILLLVLVLFLPFIDKAFHIDDVAFINFSRMIGWNPLDAIPVNYDYMGRILPNLLLYDVTHPFFVPYIIKAVTSLSGENEFSLHLVFMLFPLIAVFSLTWMMVVLFPEASQRSFLLLAVFFCAMPAFVVNGQNIMTDVPTLAFLLLALAAFLCGIEKDSRGMMAAGGAALSLAVFSSYQVAVFALLILGYFIRRRRATPYSVFCASMPLLALIIWLASVYFLYGIFPFFKSNLASSSASIGDEISRGLVQGALLKKAVFVFASIGANMLWIITAFYVVKKKLGKFIAVFAGMFAITYPISFFLAGYGVAANFVFAAFMNLGVLTVVTMIGLVREKNLAGHDVTKDAFLLVWFFCVICYNIAVFPFGAERYLLPALPPALLILMSDQAWAVTDSVRKTALACIAVVALVFVFASAFSDYKYAETYRAFAEEVRQFRTAAPETAKIWYIGEWGMRYYMNKAGGRYLHADSEKPERGDYVIIPEMPRLWAPSPRLMERLEFFAQRSYASPLPIRLFNQRSKAGFYSHLWGMLPFSFSFEPDEEFVIYRVSR